ncbi:MAG: hypothetical protein BHW33_04250 [Firmicutes bacterium CAG:137_57_8]|nr:MAG: hypothetical protein BHW33_04250 [Firmicutes bacterium CAG:137_57_8]
MWEETYMLFRKKIPGSCQYCAHGVRLEGGQIVCVKKGLLEGDCACRRFHYDPLKRIPPRRKAVEPGRFFSLSFHGICWKAEW